MCETLHINLRSRQREIANQIIEITFEYSKIKGDKIRLGTRLITELLRTHNELKIKLLNIIYKSGLIVFLPVLLLSLHIHGDNNITDNLAIIFIAGFLTRDALED